MKLKHIMAGAAVSTALITTPSSAIVSPDATYSDNTSNQPTEPKVSCRINEPAQSNLVVSELSMALREAYEDSDTELTYVIPYKTSHASTPDKTFDATQVGSVFEATIHHGPLAGTTVKYDKDTNETTLNGEMIDTFSNMEDMLSDNFRGQKAIVGDLSIEVGQWDNGNYILNISEVGNPKNNFLTHLNAAGGQGYHLATITEVIEPVPTEDNKQHYKTLHCSRIVEYPQGRPFHDIMPAMKAYERTLEP